MDEWSDQGNLNKPREMHEPSMDDVGERVDQGSMNEPREMHERSTDERNYDSDEIQRLIDEFEEDSRKRHRKTHVGPPVKLNQKAKKTGRPKTNVKATAAVAKEDRVIFNACQAAKKYLGVATLEALWNLLDDTKPGLQEVSKQLVQIPTRYNAHANKKPRYSCIENVEIIEDVFYFLPPKLLKACMNCLPVASTAEDATTVVTLPSTVPESTEPEARHKRKEVVAINGIDSFSRRQIQAMQAVTGLRDLCALGMKMMQWMLRTARMVPASHQHVVHELIDEIRDAFLSRVVSGFSEPFP